MLELSGSKRTLFFSGVVSLQTLIFLVVLSELQNQPAIQYSQWQLQMCTPVSTLICIVQFRYPPIKIIGYLGTHEATPAQVVCACNSHSVYHYVCMCVCVAANEI